MNKAQILDRAITTHGAVKQTEMLQEEVGELLTAINKLKRATPEGIELFSYPTKETNIKYSLAYFNLCSEIADCKILLSQLEKIFSKEAVDISEERKIIRLEERLNKGTF